MDEPEELSTAQRQPAKLLMRAAIVTVVLAVLLGGSSALWVYAYLSRSGPPGPAEVVVIIPPGAHFKQTAEILAANGLIHEDIRFRLLARIYGLAGKVRAGEFKLHTGSKPLELLKELIGAAPLQHAVTIVEGLRATEIAEVLALKDWCSQSEFLELIHDSEFIASLGLQDIPSLEGYLYPDTYHLTRIPSLSTKDVVEMMVRRFFQVWKELGGAEERRHETVILASIVEKETGAAPERPLIASVFYNRLRRGMRLQSDPTVIYGIDNFNGNLTREDLQRDTPYNTYVISGLPAGPICNPGKAALEAVLHPAEENYLYFVSKNDGTHYFSRSLREHNRAVNKYQRSRKK